MTAKQITGSIMAPDGSQYVTLTDGAGNLVSSAITPSTTTITGGTNTRVLFDDSGKVGEDSGLTYVKGTGNLSAGGNVQAAGHLFLGANNAVAFATGTRTEIRCPADGQLVIQNSAGTARASLLYLAFTSTKTTNYPVVALDSGTHFNNSGAGGAVTFTLPTAAAGLQYTFTTATAQNVVLTATGGAKIYNGASVSTANGTATNAASIKSTIDIYCDGTDWVTRGITGTWTLA